LEDKGEKAVDASWLVGWFVYTMTHYVKDRFTQTSAIAICRTTAVSPQVNTPNLPVTTFCSF